MTEHRHREPVVVFRTYEGLAYCPTPPAEDLEVVCRDCLAEIGLIAGDVGGGEDGIAWWDVDLYPFDETAKLGDDCWRPNASWPPSLGEVRDRRARA